MKAMLIMVLLLFCSQIYGDKNESIEFVTSAYEPYVIENNNEASGIFPDLITSVFSRFSVNVKFQFQPWTRCEELVKEGKAFATFPYVINAERTKSFNFSEPIIYFFPKFFYLKANFPDGFNWHTLKDFQPYVIGGVLGYWYESAFKEQEVNVHYATSDIQNIYKLMNQRIDFTLIDELVGWRLIDQAYPRHRRSFAVAPKPESANTFHLMISRQFVHNQKLTEQFNKGLAYIKADGTYQRIFRRYGVPMEYATSW
ncbi:substrate-binding periplasmic protein [Spartinivicinus ruber]|uniref:substrate-binding periplasmic protein n=1 Tax=Spartinivicinus ruber TaxID=2683272 RepID=UPI0013D14021|nr:transporter substrate-binding domain-containing protein [Spartinivicinus ruber]